MPRRRGLCIIFSGLDGGGKSTQIDGLMVNLRAAGLRPVRFWTRGGYSPAFNSVKFFLRRVSRGRLVPPPDDAPRRERAFAKWHIRHLWLWMAALELIWAYGVKIRWWLWHGRAVVCDRYLGDTVVDIRVRMPQEEMKDMWLWRLLFRVAPQPDAAFLLWVPVEEALRRITDRGDTPTSDLDRRLAEYQALSRQGQWHVLDGRRPVAELAEEIREKVFALEGMRAS